MGLIIAALVAGFLIGAGRLLPAGSGAALGRFMTVALFAMLVALGAQIGANRELLANLPALGWRALVISTLSVAGSVAALCLVARHCRLADRPSEREGD